MAIPDGMTIATWFNGVCGDLSAANSELATFQKYWSSFTAAQKLAIKNLVNSQIDAATVELAAIKAEINRIV